jgi:HEAT repeat protein
MAALYAAELREPCDLERLPIDSLRELFQSAAQLRQSIPYATVCLLGRLASDMRVEVRTQVAHSLSHFVDAYPDRVEELLLLLSCDPSRKVRQAAASALAVATARRTATSL